MKITMTVIVAELFLVNDISPLSVAWKAHWASLSSPTQNQSLQKLLQSQKNKCIIYRISSKIFQIVFLCVDMYVCIVNVSQ